MNLKFSGDIIRASAAELLILIAIFLTSVKLGNIDGFQQNRGEFEKITCNGYSTTKSSEASSCVLSALFDIQYVATLREQLEQLSEERNPDGLLRLSKAQLNEYSEKIEEIATRIVVSESSKQDSQEPTFETKESHPKTEEEVICSPRGLRRRLLPPSDNRKPTTVDESSSVPLVKLDTGAQAHIERHRKLQEDLTDEMVGLARQLKESSLMMNQSIKSSEKILDSTQKAFEQSLASTGRANTRAMEIYSRSRKTSCFTWLLMFAMNP